MCFFAPSGGAVWWPVLHVRGQEADDHAEQLWGAEGGAGPEG